MSRMDGKKTHTHTLPTWDTLMIRLQQSRNPRCKSAPTVRDRSKHVRKHSLPNIPSLKNAFQGGNSELTLQCKSCHKQEEKGRARESVPQRFPTIFKSQNHFIILNLPFTYNSIFRLVHFQDQPKVTLSFKTEQCCAHV